MNSKEWSLLGQSKKIHKKFSQQKNFHRHKNFLHLKFFKEIPDKEI